MTPRFIHHFKFTKSQFNKILLLATVTLFISGPSYANTSPETATCSQNGETLNARYFLKTKSGMKKARSKELVLWRKSSNAVALQDTSKGITEIWSRDKQGRSRPIRYFEEYQRGIEYFPSEVKNSSSKLTWQHKFQLIDDNFRSRMKLVATEGEGCDRIETYQMTVIGTKFKLRWLPELNLVVEYSEESLQKNFHIVLKQTHTDTQVINDFFAQHADYQTTDFADVGDNEHDPFLLKMINLGFVEHGASGYYNADGSQITGAHGHFH